MKKTVAFLLATLLVFSGAVAVSAENEENSSGTESSSTADTAVDSGDATGGNEAEDTEAPQAEGENGAEAAADDAAPAEGAPAEGTPAEAPPAEEAKPKPTSLAEATEGMKKVAEGENNALYLNEKNGSLRYISKKTLQYADTKQMESNSGNDISKNTQKSDATFTYISDLKSGALTTADDFTMALDKGNMTVEEIENGVRLKYVMGETKLTMESFPQYVAQEKFERLILSKLDYDQKETIKELYRLRDGRYTRTKKGDDAITQLGAKVYYNLIYEVGDYTQEDMEADNAEFGVELKVKPLHIEFYIDYKLDGDDLVAAMPLGEIVSNEQLPIQSISFLPYFVTATKDQQGYMMVPDGSGALIDLNSKNLSANSYNGTVYGKDTMLYPNKYVPRSTKNVTLPVYGMKADDMALMGIIEEGAGFADISAEVSGKTDEFNRMSLNFNVRPLERVQSVNTSNITMTKWLNKFYDGNIQVRYKMLSGENADYSGMAVAYKDYLIGKGELTPIDSAAVKAETPLAVEMLGAIDRRELFLGVSYDSTGAMTNFKDAAAIMKDLKASGVGNMKVEYTGWLKGGLKQPSLTNSPAVDPSLGSKSGFKNLLATAQSEGIDFYPAANFDVVIGKKGFSPTKYAARGLSGAPSFYQPFDQEAVLFNYSNDYGYYISPNYFPDYVAKAAANLSKMGVTNIASTTGWKMLSPDYNKNAELTREESISQASKALSTLTGEGSKSMMLSNPNGYAYKYADVISDVPFESNNYKIFSKSVPFVQMVLSGCVEYTSESLNLRSDRPTQYQIMKCMETGSTPKFVLSQSGKKMLEYTTYDTYYDPAYAVNKEDVLAVYQGYTPFYQAVKGAAFVSHGVESDGLVVCSYSNGVKVLLNYTSKALSYQGQTVEAGNYAIVN